MRRALAVLCLVLAACSDDGERGLPDTSTLDWEECGRRTECATLTVPLDWSRPDGVTIDLAVARAPATGERIGVLVTNPGGPGASGVAFAAGGGLFRGTALAERFDIVSWDPRGVGGSAPLTCAVEEAEAFLRLDPDPDDAAEQTELDDAARAVADDCARDHTDLLPHVGTAAAVRDLEALREALDAPMVYVGFSYGTLLGLRYAEAFPEGAEAMVLDGVADPSHSLPDLLRAQAAAFDRVLADVLGDDGLAAWDRLAAEIEAGAVDGVTPADLATATIFAAYQEVLWDDLRAALDDPARLRPLADGYRTLVQFAPYQAVSCIDAEHPVGAEAWAAFAAELESVSPRLGAAIANEMLPCAFWPVPPQPAPGASDAAAGPRTLVVGTTGDPATPVAQAERVAADLPDGHLLVFDGPGHTAFATSACVREAVTRFLLDGQRPPARCE